METSARFPRFQSTCVFTSCHVWERLAKGGPRKEQLSKSTTYKDTKPMINTKQLSQSTTYKDTKPMINTKQLSQSTTYKDTKPMINTKQLSQSTTYKDTKPMINTKQLSQSTTYKDTKPMINTKQHQRWLQQRPNFSRADGYHCLTRPEQASIFRLCAGHNRMKYHLGTEFGMGQSCQCPCITAIVTADHWLQSCPL